MRLRRQQCLRADCRLGGDATKAKHNPSDNEVDQYSSYMMLLFCITAPMEFLRITSHSRRIIVWFSLFFSFLPGLSTNAMGMPCFSDLYINLFSPFPCPPLNYPCEHQVTASLFLGGLHPCIFLCICIVMAIGPLAGTFSCSCRSASHSSNLELMVSRIGPKNRLNHACSSS